MTAESDRLATELRAIGADAAVLVRAEDICYATGFEVPPPIDAGAAFAYGPTLALVGQDGATVLLSPAAYAARVEEMSRADASVLVDGFGHFEPVEAHERFVQAIAAALRDLGTRPESAVAIDPSWTPVEVQQTLDDNRILDLRPAVRKARLVKTEREIDLLRQAARVCDAGHETLLERAAAGRNELELLGDVLTQRRLRGRPSGAMGGRARVGPADGTAPLSRGPDRPRARGR